MPTAITTADIKPLIDGLSYDDSSILETTFCAGPPAFEWFNAARDDYLHIYTCIPKEPQPLTFDHLLNDLDQHIGQYWYRLGGTKQYEAIKQIAHTIQDITHDIEIGTKEGSYRTRAHGLETLRESLEYVQGLGGDIDRDADVKGYVVIGMEKILETTDVGELQRLKDKGWEEDLLLTIDDEDDELLDYFKADGASKPDEDEGTETETEEDRATKKRRRNE